MRSKRKNHGCFSIKQNGVVKKVVVMGGSRGSRWSNFRSSSEVLDVQENEFKEGPGLPYPLSGISGVGSINEPYLGFAMGGARWGKRNTNEYYQRNIYGLKKQSETKWEWVKTGEMKEPRISFSVVNTACFHVYLIHPYWC